MDGTADERRIDPDRLFHHGLQASDTSLEKGRDLSSQTPIKSTSTWPRNQVCLEERHFAAATARRPRPPPSATVTRWRATVTHVPFLLACRLTSTRAFVPGFAFPRFHHPWTLTVPGTSFEWCGSSTIDWKATTPAAWTVPESLSVSDELAAEGDWFAAAGRGVAKAGGANVATDEIPRMSARAVLFRIQSVLHQEQVTLTARHR